MVSFILQNLILSSDEIPSTAKAVYMQLMARADEYRKCFPSVNTIAYYVGRSPRTVQRALKLLCEQGLIHKESRYRGNNSQTSNLYTLKEHNQIRSIESKPQKKSFVPALSTYGVEHSAATSCITVESMLDNAVTLPIMDKKSDGVCETTHTPPNSTFPIPLESTYKVPHKMAVYQEQSVNKQLILTNKKIALLFARYFIFTGISYKEVYRIMTSSEMQAAVYSNTSLNSTAKLVFVYMCAKADEQQQCIINPAKLALRFARSKRTIQRALAALYKQGLIAAEDRSKPSCIYTVKRII